MITDRAAVKAGARLSRVYKGKRYDCDVVKTKDGLRFVHAGVEYKSISGPSCFIMKSRGGTGWQFWSLAGEDGKTPATAPAKKSTAKATKKSTSMSLAREVRVNKTPTAKTAPAKTAKKSTKTASKKVSA